MLVRLNAKHTAGRLQKQITSQQEHTAHVESQKSELEVSMSALQSEKSEREFSAVALLSITGIVE